jgi:serine/threonine protein kinase
MAVSDDDLFPNLPANFGRYRVLRRLGKGGMGAVYLAEDTNLRNRKTAIKLPTKKLDGASAMRFQREAEATAVLDHPNICSVYDVGTIDGRHFLAMKYIEGRPLSDLVGKGKLWPDNSAIALVLKLAEALQYAHGMGVIHRDIKPANIMMAANDDPVLMDFGLAKFEGDPSLTVAGTIFGTPHYMPIEQARGQIQKLGPHSDVYSLAVVLFQMLTGELPFVGNTPMQLYARLAVEKVPPIGMVLPGADPQLEAVLLKAMKKPRRERCATMREFADALAACRPTELATSYPQTRPDLATEVPADYRKTTVKLRPNLAEPNPPATLMPRRSSRRRNAWLAGIAIVVLGTAGWSLSRNRGWTRTPEGSPNGPAPGDNQARSSIPFNAGETVEEFEWKGETRRRTVMAVDIGGQRIEFVKIPAGRFIMGSPDTDSYKMENEQPQQAVMFTRPLWVAKYAVTKGQFAAFAKAAPYRTEAEDGREGGWGYDEATNILESRSKKYDWERTGWPQSDRHPIVNVTHRDALAYCVWAALRANLPVRLLGDAEYEYANRAGTTARYITGDDYDSLEGYANVADRSMYAKLKLDPIPNFDDGFPFSAPVGSFRPNGFGLYDTTGNVWCWCADTFDEKLPRPAEVVDPKPNDGGAGANRILRGGSWNRSARNCRAALRNWDEPGRRAHVIGFRVCFPADR